MSAQRAPWIAYRFESDPPCEPMLTDVLAPWLEARLQEHSLRRWFFLWYSEDGFHLRVRLQPAYTQDPERLAAAMETHAAGGPRRVRPRRQTYDRDVLAFGQTRDSVLAELLHAATSKLALSLLPRVGAGAARGQRWIVTAAAVAVLARRAIGGDELDGAMAAWTEFAVHALRRRGVGTRPGVIDRRSVRLSSLDAVVPRMRRALDSVRSARDIAALIRRARERGTRGRLVATHALHLFCNEMGIGLAEELDIVRSVREFLRARPELQLLEPNEAHL
jgi:thiopeptide-type bacteriocin biosynthesis protein